MRISICRVFLRISRGIMRLIFLRFQIQGSIRKIQGNKMPREEF